MQNSIGYIALLVVAAFLPAPNTAAAQQQALELTGTIAFDIGSPSGAVQKIMLTVGDGGTGPYSAVLAGDTSLATHSICRPRDLSPFGPRNALPIVAWANGGCRSSSGEFRNFLSEIASHGFLVVTIGPAAHSAVMGSEAPIGTSQASQLIDGVNWAMAQNEAQGNEYYQKIATNKVAVMGQSCGCVQALDVSNDPRISTTVVWKCGVFELPPPASGDSPMRSSMARMTKERLSELHKPVAYLIGGSSDIAFKNADDDFEWIDHVPIFLANQDVGHYPATYREPNGGAFARAGVAWLKWQHKEDEMASQLFIGEDCGLCRDSSWTVQRKNLR